MYGQKINVKTPEEYIQKLEEPRKSEIQKTHEFIVNTVPELKPYIISGMIGYGSYHYKYATGREGDWCVIGLASNKNYISIYICPPQNQEYIPEKYKDNLPKASIGKSCIRYKKYEDIEFDELAKLLKLASEIKEITT